MKGASAVSYISPHRDFPLNSVSPGPLSAGRLPPGRRFFEGHKDTGMTERRSHGLAVSGIGLAVIGMAMPNDGLSVGVFISGLGAFGFGIISAATTYSA